MAKRRKKAKKAKKKAKKAKKRRRRRQFSILFNLLRFSWRLREKRFFYSAS